MGSFTPLEWFLLVCFLALAIELRSIYITLKDIRAHLENIERNTDKDEDGDWYPPISGAGD